MTVENYLAEAAALSGAGWHHGGIFAGRCHSTSYCQHRRLITAGIVIFAAASVMFLYSLIVAVLSLVATAELNRSPDELLNLGTGALLILFAATYVFIGGIGMTGWMRSRLAGILTTVLALISGCLITYAIGSVISLFI